MNVLFAIVEMSPLAKVGGLGDVAGSLPRALRARGIDVRVVLPMHGAIERAALDLRHVLHGVPVRWPGGDERVDLWLTNSRDVPVYLIENERFFGRPDVYGYDDDVERMLFYCDAVAACSSHIGFAPDVVHAHDWHAGLLLARLAEQDAHPWSQCARVFTLHNLGLQGAFDRDFADAHGFPDASLQPPAGVSRELAMSAVAQGIIHADRITTVSDAYAREILTPEFGAGLDQLLAARSDALSGIVNGIDYDEFNPRTDRAIAQRYSAETLDRRAANKSALQKRAGLPVADETPLFGVVTRLFPQKGIDLAAAAFAAILTDQDAQLVVLGTGDPEVHEALLALQQDHPASVKVWLDFDPPLGQQIYAGCDCFVMPSRYEPCGLGQLIALRYGAVPLVRRTGGLSDTVEDASGDVRRGTGFVFDAFDSDELCRTIERVIAAYSDRAAWRAMQQRGMGEDWSWTRASKQYGDLYEDVVAERREAQRARGAPA